MALSLTRIQFLGLALILIAGVTTAFGQDYWSVQKPMSCHPKLLSSVHGGIFQPQVKQYEWQGRVTNTYDQTVTFDMYMKVGNQKKSIGRFTVEPGKSTNATSLYYDDPSKLLEISVDNVCFLKGGCKKTCYAGCDDGRSINQPSCDDQPTSPTSNQNQNPTSNTGTANNAEAIKQKIKQNLEKNLAAIDITPYGVWSNFEVSVDERGVSIKFNYKTNYVTLSNTYNETFQQLSKTMKGAPGTFPPGVNSLDFGYGGNPCVSSGDRQGSCAVVPYRAGPNDQNFNELKALAAELAGAPSSTQPTASNAEAIIQKIVENIRANIMTGTHHDDYSNSDTTFSNLSVQTQGDSILITFHQRWQELGRRSWSWLEWDMSVKTLVSDLPGLVFRTNRYPSFAKKGYGFFYTNQMKCNARMTASWAGKLNRDDDGCGLPDILYDPGPNNQNLNELKALIAQLAGAPSSTQNSSNGTNNSSGNSSVPTNTGSSSPGSKKEAPETIPKAAYDIMVAGDQHYNAKNYAAALESYKRAAEIVPNSPTVNFYLADAYAMSAKYTEAAAAYQKAIENRPNYVAAYTALANNLDRLNRKDEAIEWLKKGVRAVPDNARLWYNLGDRVSRASASGVDGLAFLQKSVELDPKCMDCQSSIADAFAKLEQWDAAVRSYEIVFQLDPGDGRLMPYGPLMNAYNRVGKYAEAVRKYLNLEAHADPSYKRQMSNFVHLQLGIAYCGLKDKPKAMAALARLKSCPTCSNMESEELLQKIKSTWPTKPTRRK